MKQWTRVLFVGGLIAAAAVACDDGDSGGGKKDATGGAGTGGAPSTGAASNSTGGAANTGGANLGGGGMGGDVATGGTATGGTQGVSDACADGCAVISAPLTAADQAASFQFWLNATDLSDETLTFRVYVKEGTAGGFQYGFQNGAPNYPGTWNYWHNLAPAGGDWHDLTIDLTQYAPVGGGNGGEGGQPASTGPDSSLVEIIFLQVSSGDSGPWTNPSVVYIDSVKSSNGTIDFEFEGGVANLHAGGSNVAGSSVTHTLIDP